MKQKGTKSVINRMLTAPTLESLKSLPNYRFSKISRAASRTLYCQLYQIFNKYRDFAFRLYRISINFYLKINIL